MHKKPAFAVNVLYPFACTLFSVVLLAACTDDNSSAPDEPIDTFNAAIVCPAEGMNSYGEPNRGTFTDARDGQVYKYTTIGNQVWMAENLKFDAPYSVCYDKIEGFCDTFGRFYSLHEDGKLFGLFDQELLVTVCPAGWHVPSIDEWGVLIKEMGGEKNALSRLYSSEDFGERFMKSSDDCGFNSLPAGSWLSGGGLASEYFVSIYWTSTAIDLQASYACFFGYSGISFGINGSKMSLRCIRN